MPSGCSGSLRTQDERHGREDGTSEGTRHRVSAGRMKPASRPAPESKRWYDDGTGWGLSAAGLALVGAGAGLLAYGSLLVAPKTGSPDAIVKDWGPFGMFSGGYRVTTPLLGALLMRVAGASRYTFAILFMVGVPVLT